MARINISVSDELLEKVNRFREEMNISEICRKAIEARVLTLERVFDKVFEERGKIVVRKKRKRGKRK